MKFMPYLLLVRLPDKHSSLNYTDFQNIIIVSIISKIISAADISDVPLTSLNWASEKFIPLSHYFIQHFIFNIILPQCDI